MKNNIKKIILEEIQLLLELNFEDVKRRFKSKKFLKTFAPEGYKKIKASGDKETDFFGIPRSMRPEGDLKLLSRIARAFLLTVPREGIEESHRAEFLNWLISWAIESKKSTNDSELWEYALSTDSTLHINHRLGLHKLQKAVRTFYEIKEQGLSHFLAVSDIRKIRSPKHLIIVVEVADIAYEQYKKDKVYYSTNIDPEEHKIFEDSEWIVYIPRTKGAACALGSPAMCTTTRKPTRSQDPEGKWVDPYLYYHPNRVPDERYPLIIFHYKQDPERPFQFYYAGKREFVNHLNKQLFNNPTEDKTINIERQLTFHYINNIVKEKLRDILPKQTIDVANAYSIALSDGKDGSKFRETTPLGVRWFDSSGGYHRIGAPATISLYGLDNNGDPITIESWYQNNKLHREDGPAVESSNGLTKIYWLEGVYYEDIEDWKNAVKRLKDRKKESQESQESQDLQESITIKTLLDLNRKDFETKRIMGQISPEDIKKWYKLNGHTEKIKKEKNNIHSLQEIRLRIKNIDISRKNKIFLNLIVKEMKNLQK